VAADIDAINARVREQSRFVEAVKAQVGRVIVGQEYLIDRLLVALLCSGHVLIEGVPGLAKTLAVSTLAQAISASFVRIQFTPDLLPADLTGTTVFNPRDGQFHVRQGPVFANVVLADEVNRAPAKVQSALLEAMQERQVSIGGTTFPLEEPFMVLATQNPIEHEGTYPLPEAQVDAVVARDDILAAREAVQAVHLEDDLKDYILHLVFATREPHSYRLDGLSGLIAYGASPRASIYLAQTAKAHAFVHGRGYVTPDDVKAVAMDVLRHRVIVTYEAEAEDLSSEDIVRRVLEGVPVP